MPTLEIRRHSFTRKGDARGRGSHLSAEGVIAARRLGASLGPFDYVVASTSPRTLETAIAMGFAVDDLVAMPSPVDTGDIEFHAWREWDDPFTMLRTKAGKSPLVRTYIDEQTRRVVGLTEGVGREGRVLLVAHGGWMESVVAGLVEQAQLTHLGGSFWHLDGVRLSINAGGAPAIAAVERYPR